MLLVLPVANLLVQLTLVNTVLAAVGHMPGVPRNWDALQRQVLAQAYPAFVQVCTIVSGGLFVVAVMKDHFDGLRCVLNFAGMRSLSYKGGLLLAEYTLFAALATLFIATGSVLSNSAFRSHWQDYAVALFAFGLPYVTLTNVLSYALAWFLASNPSKASEKGFQYVILPTMALYMASTALTHVPAFASSEWVHYASPFNCLTKAFNLIMMKSASDPSSQLHAIRPYVFAMVAQSVILFVLAVYLDHRRVNGYKGADGRDKYNDGHWLPENADVAEHRAQTHAAWDGAPKPAGGPEYLLEAKDLLKVYDGSQGPIAAVMQNSFCVAKGEIFGLLGPNGAGKSSTFNMLTLGLQRSAGDCRIAHTPIDDLNILGQKITLGMCAQHNTIWEALTVDQSLRFIGEVKGLGAEDIAKQVKFIKETLDLGPFAETRAVNLSGGNKRKLVCAMSLVGYPEIEFLDEPTTGVDPVSCRSLFRMLKGLKGSSMVLTTHRMDEAESLCDNIAIQINGRFVCYGPPGHLKSTYGKGYTVMLKYDAEGESDLEEYLKEKMPYM